MAPCLKLLENVRRDLLAYDNGCLYTVCHFIPMCLYWVLMRRLGREAPLDLQVRIPHSRNPVMAVDSMHGGRTSNKDIWNVLTATWLLSDTLQRNTWSCLKVIYFKRGLARDVIKHTVDAGDVLPPAKTKIKTQGVISHCHSVCIVSFLLRGRGQ